MANVLHTDKQIAAVSPETAVKSAIVQELKSRGTN